MLQADVIIDRQQALHGQRAIQHSLNRQIAERIDVNNPILGARRMDMSQVLDSEPMRLIQRLTSSMEDILTPHGTKWSELGYREEGKRSSFEKRRYAEQMSQLLDRVRFGRNAGFRRAKRACFHNLACYGHELLFTREMMGYWSDGRQKPFISYGTLPVTLCDFAYNEHGIVEEVYYRHEKTAAQLVADPILTPSKKVAELAADPTRRHEKVEIIWAVMANEDFQMSKKSTKDVIGEAMKGRKGMRSKKGKMDYGMTSDAFPYRSIWIEAETRHILHESGFQEFPFHHSDMEASDDALPFALSPAMVMLPDVKFLYTLKEITVLGLEQSVLPAHMTTEKLDFDVDMTANAIMEGALDPDGNPKIRPYVTGANPTMGERWMELTSQDLRSSAHMDLFQVLVNKPNQSATEAQLREQEKGALLGPAFANQEMALSDMTYRELKIIERMGERGLLDVPRRPFGVGIEDLQLEFKNPLQRLRRISEARAISQTLEFSAQMENMAPGITSRKLDVERAVDLMAEINGTPLSVLRSQEEIEQLLRDQQAHVAAAQNAS